MTLKLQDRSQLTKDVDLHQAFGHLLQQVIKLPSFGNELGLDVLDIELFGLTSTVVALPSRLLVVLRALHWIRFANHAQKRAQCKYTVLRLEDGEKVLE